MNSLNQTFLNGLKNYSNSNNLTYRNKVTGELVTAAEYGHYFGRVQPYLYDECMVAGLKLLKGNVKYEIHITDRDIENLKKEWLADPVWDIEDTEGYESVRDELKAFSDNQTSIWNREYELKAAQRRADAKALKVEQDKEALEMGVEGLYRILLKQQQQVNDLQNIMNALVACNDTQTALRIMQDAIANKRWVNESEGGF